MAELRRGNYAEMVAEAEAAVGQVKDPDLRRAAFEKILTALLEQDAPSKRRTSSTTTLKRAVSGNVGPAKKRGRAGPMAYIQELIDDDFFEKQKSISEVRVELASRGHHIPLTSLSGPLQSMVKHRRLRRQKSSADGAKGKNVYGYSNW